MQRHMQTISFIAIVGVLLSCSFFFSQLTNLGTRDFAATNTPLQRGESIEDLPVCTDDMKLSEKMNCYENAVMISERIIDEKIDDILGMESASEKRLAIVEANIAWAHARDAECDLMMAMESGEEQKQLEMLSCIHDQNLTRIETLEGYLCRWYLPSTCQRGESALDSSGQ
jgi:uncharacterized protein YecT (DUF1311 family)